MSTAAPSQRPTEHGSRTMTINPTLTPDSGPSNPDPAGEGGQPTVGVLRLRGGPVRRQKVVWSEETVDNEGMGKKKSKSRCDFLDSKLVWRQRVKTNVILVCCIYHRPKAFDESSSESSSSSEGEDGHPGEKDGGKLKDGQKRREKSRKKKGKTGAESLESESEGGAGEGRAR